MIQRRKPVRTKRYGRKCLSFVIGERRDEADAAQLCAPQSALVPVRAGFAAGGLVVIAAAGERRRGAAGFEG